jgi:hypothetical protein
MLGSAQEYGKECRVGSYEEVGAAKRGQLESSVVAAGS